MHLIWENLIKNLIKLWTGDYKDMDEGAEEYQFEKSIWQAIGEATFKSGSTIPSAYGTQVPNLAGDGTHKPYLSAEMLSFWALYLGPVLLKNRFTKPRYYTHFIRLVRLLNICLQFEISSNDLDELRNGFISWVKDYERLYYQYNPERLPACPLTVHALLHIAPSIEASGPVWCYWAFPMERYCGTIQPAIRSRRFPFASLARHVIEDARLTQIKLFYDVVQDLSLSPPRLLPITGSFTHPSYPSCQLLPPKGPERPGMSTLTLLIGALVTRFSNPGIGLIVTPGIVKQCLYTADVSIWGKVRRIDSEEGDTMRGAGLGTIREDGRDASFIRYELLVDQLASQISANPDFEPETCFGQLQHIYLIRFNKPYPELGLYQSSTTIIMASIKKCNLTNESIPGLDIHFYSRMGATDVIDIRSVQCVVGRVPYGQNGWAIIDRSGTLARAEFLGGNNDEDIDNEDI
ncbi:hypothetical protein K435DRAFT_670956 [Dendrothele bispora CBS 962.96]|uniref:DUF4218 domain-containing protein n=1 Tax=Dendrothele bispora (strain CBS 962.96) TaxID=1314807 RepID=A0A4S8LU29_DENBC|nr:hypothetical protein K435DRAFT_670956 [Dendrothele bispora CBS 962.96]